VVEFTLKFDAKCIYICIDSKNYYNRVVQLQNGHHNWIHTEIWSYIYVLILKPMASLGNIFTFIQYGTYDICPGPVFWCEFNGGVHFVIGLTIYGNFSIYISPRSIFWYEFNDGIHLMIKLTIFDPVFQCEFNGGVHFVIRLAIFGNFTKHTIYISSRTCFSTWIFGNFSKFAISISAKSVFQCEFNHYVYFDIRLTILSNLFILYVYICVIYHFWAQMQP